MITTVIFDMDDTLYDEIEYCRSGFGAVSKHIADSNTGFNSNKIFDILWSEFTAGNHKTTFNAALDKLDIPYDDKLIRELVEAYRNHKPRITLPQDSKSVLDEMHSKYTLALLTDGFLPAQRLKVEALGIERYFKAIIYTEELGRDCWKPSPVGFEKILSLLETSAESAVYIADNVKKDFIAANKLGIATIQLVRPAGIHKHTSDNPTDNPQHVICEITELPSLIAKI